MLGNALKECVLYLMRTKGEDVSGAQRVLDGSGMEGELWVGGTQVCQDTQFKEIHRALFICVVFDADQG